MRRILVLNLFLAILTKDLSAQDCDVLNALNVWHGLKFGNQINDTILSRFRVRKSNDASYTDYVLSHKSILSNVRPNSKFYNWFYFGDIEFTNITLSLLPDKKFYEYDLSKVYRKDEISSLEDSIEIVNGKLPKTFLRASDEISRLFGKMTSSEDHQDILGIHVSRVWQCDSIKINLHLWLDSSAGEISLFTLVTGITITDRKLEKIQKINHLKQE